MAEAKGGDGVKAFIKGFCGVIFLFPCVVACGLFIGFYYLACGRRAGRSLWAKIVEEF